MAKTYQYCVAENWGKDLSITMNLLESRLKAIQLMFGKFCIQQTC